MNRIRIRALELFLENFKHPNKVQKKLQKTLAITIAKQMSFGVFNSATKEGIKISKTILKAKFGFCSSRALGGCKNNFVVDPFMPLI